MDRVSCTLVLLFSLLCCSSAHARTTIVPDDFPTLQAAADALYEPWAVDTLLVRGGIYPEHVHFRRGIRVEAIPTLHESDDVPQIQGLQTSSDNGEHFLFIGLHFTGNVQHGGSNGLTRIQFVGCRFDGGITPGGVEVGDLATVRLTRCSLYQSVLISADEGVIDSCAVYGPVVLSTPYRAIVVDNSFENAGTAVYARTRNAVVARNRVRGGEHAFVAYPDDGIDVHIADNDIEGCRGFAIHVIGAENGIRLERNRIARCGGFGARLIGSIQARDNRVTDCRGAGLDLLQLTGSGIVEDNVVGRCDAGILVTGYPWDPADFTVRENTVHGCNGPGIAISSLPGSTITRNIVYACLALSAVDSDPLDVSCNDWFQVLGTPSSTQDVSVDPQFCDIATDDVRLRSDSALLGTPCGRIGALGQGCEAPAVAMGFELSPHVVQPAARARWMTAWLEPPAPFTVQEIDVASVRVNDVAVAQGSEVTVGDQDRDGIPDLELRFERATLERTLAPGDAVTVQVTGRMGVRTFVGSDVIRVLRHDGGPRPSVPRPALRVLSIQAPTTGGVARSPRVTFTLVDESPAHLEVLDVAGRVVASHDVGSKGPGEHTLDLADDGRLAQGIYFLRLRQGTSEARMRCVVVR